MSLIKKTIPELLAHIATLKGYSKVEKQQILTQSVDKPTHQILEFLYNPENQFTQIKRLKYVSDMPSGRGVRRLEKYVHTIELLKDESVLSLPRKESVFYQMCECLDEDEVAFVLGIIKGKSSVKGINKKFLFDTFCKEIIFDD